MKKNKLKQSENEIGEFVYVPKSKEEAELIMLREACSAYKEREDSYIHTLKERDEKINRLNNVIKDAMSNYEELSQATKVFIKLCEGTADIGLYVALGSTGSCEGPMNMFCGVFASEETALRKILKDHNDKVLDEDKEKFKNHYYLDKQTDIDGEHELMYSHTYPNGEVYNRYIMTVNIEKININEVY